MAARCVKSIKFKARKRKRGFYQFVNGRTVWRDALDQTPVVTGHSCTSQNRCAGLFGIESAASTAHVVNDDPNLQAQSPSIESGVKKSYAEKKKTTSGHWATLRDQFVHCLVENAYPAQFTCSFCKESSEEKCIFRCPDCGPHAYFCKQCCEKQHSIVFLHIPQMWNAELQCFQECSTKSLWKRPDSHYCPSTKLTPIVIIDDKGRQHYHELQVCKCDPTPVIMLKYGLWPASPRSPRVAFTLDFMLNLRAMVLEGQMSLLAFCTAVQQCRRGLSRDLTDEKIKDLYRVINWETVLNFMAVYHSLTYMQFGEIGLPDGTKCAVCPKLTDNEGRRMAMDGNMNLVHRRKAGHSTREPIHQNQFFLPQDEVDQYLKANDHRTKTHEKNCSNFQADSVLRTKNKTEKLDVTGTFASICSHDFPCSIFNLRHGEKMAYPIFMMRSMENVKILLYDLGCQMETVLKNRAILTDVTLGVPIFHVHGHNMSCQLNYNPRSLPGAGLFDGEGTERLWSYLGKFCRMTKEMTPENRIDLIAEALLNYGQKITLKMGRSLCLRLARAYVLRESTKKTIEEDLPLYPGMTMADIEVWSQEEREAAASNAKSTIEAWEETYALELHKYYAVLEEVEREADDFQHSQLKRLATSLRRIEKDNHVKERWSKTSRQFRRHLPAACLSERTIKLADLRDKVVEYSFMVSKKSEAKGQSQAKRVTQQAISSSKKVNTALKAYNDVPPYGEGLPHRLQRSDVAALDAAIWYHLSPNVPDESGVPALAKRKFIDSQKLNNRANEEITMTANDMKRLVRSLHWQDQTLSSKIESLKEKESLTVFDHGCLSLLIRRLSTVNSWQNAVVRILDKQATSDKASALEFVDEIEAQMDLTSHQNPDQVPHALDKSLKEIMDYILALEKENDLEEEHIHEELREKMP